MDAETWKQVLTFLGTAGGAVFIGLFGNAIKKLWTGVATRERVKTTSLVRRTEAAEKKTDEAQAEMEQERKLRLKAEYHVARLQHQVILLGSTPVKNNMDEEQIDG